MVLALAVLAVGAIALLVAARAVPLMLSMALMLGMLLALLLMAPMLLVVLVGLRRLRCRGRGEAERRRSGKEYGLHVSVS